jgi:8-oxo-dGTP pyrophosphatase MutT (NUDIX family)
LEFGESPEVAVHREVLEETGLEVTPDKLLRAWVFEPEPGTQILIVSYGCSVHSGLLRRSTEHSAVIFHQPAELNQLNLPEGYRTDIDRWIQMQ